MALAHTLHVPEFHVASVSASWTAVPQPGGLSSLRLPPAAESGQAAASCELALHPRSSGAAGCSRENAVTLLCGARLVELRLQGRGDREPQYVATLRGQAVEAAECAGSSASGSGSGGGGGSGGSGGKPGHGLWRFSIVLPAGWQLAHLKLLSLVDKGVCPLALTTSGSEAPGTTAGAAGACPPATGHTPGSGNIAGISMAAPLSQLEELRMLVQHAAAGKQRGGTWLVLHVGPAWQRCTRAASAGALLKIDPPQFPMNDNDIQVQPVTLQHCLLHCTCCSKR